MEDNDYKYILQDTGNIYLGARFSYQELMEQEMVPFKLKAIITHYLEKEVDLETTLESSFYYMEEKGFVFETCKQLKPRIKVQILENRKSLFGGNRSRYTEKVLKLSELTGLNLAQKKSRGLVVREIIFPKLALMTFSV